MMNKKKYVISFLVFLISCSIREKQMNQFMNFAYQEKSLKESNPIRVFNTDPAILISTLPNQFGNYNENGEIKNYERLLNGAGYSKSYINKKYKDKCIITIYTYHAKQIDISNNLDNSVNKKIYDNIKKDFLSFYPNSQILSDDVVVYTTPSNKVLNTKEIVFDYYNQLTNQQLMADMYFGTILDSYFIVKISYDNNLVTDTRFLKEKRLFMQDFAYFVAEGISLDEYNSFKKKNTVNPVKIQRIRKK